MCGINNGGLTKTQTYEYLIEDVIGIQARIPYPSRDAKLQKESPTLINLLDGDGQGIMELDKFDKKKKLVTEQANRIQEMATDDNTSTQEIRAGMPPR